MRQGCASHLESFHLWSSLLVAPTTRHISIPGSWSAWIAPVQALLLLLDDVPVGFNRLARKAFISHRLCLLFLTLIYVPWKEAGNIQLQFLLFQNHGGPHLAVTWLT